MTLAFALQWSSGRPHIWLLIPQILIGLARPAPRLRELCRHASTICPEFLDAPRAAKHRN
jgi:hypothetical protein